MISSYRLGDLVLLHLSESEQNDILDDHPNTIGSEYILAKTSVLLAQTLFPITFTLILLFF